MSRLTDFFFYTSYSRFSISLPRVLPDGTIVSRNQLGIQLRYLIVPIPEICLLTYFSHCIPSIVHTS